MTHCARKCPNPSCPRGDHDYSWADERFGCMRDRLPRIKIGYTLRGKDGTGRDYREDLARFPNDPEAYVDGPVALQKLKDKRLRQGWTFGRLEDVDLSPPGDLFEGRDLAREAYEEAKAGGFDMNDPDVLDAQGD